MATKNTRVQTARVARKATARSVPQIRRGALPTAPAKPALSIQRGGGKAMTVNGKTTKAQPLAKPAKAKPAPKTTERKKAQPRVVRDKSFVELDNMSRESVRALAALVRREIEGKPLRKRKIYPQRSSKTIRVPLPLVPEVQAMIEKYRKKHGLPSVPGRVAAAKPVEQSDDDDSNEEWRKD